MWGEKLLSFCLNTVCGTELCTPSYIHQSEGVVDVGASATLKKTTSKSFIVWEWRLIVFLPDSVDEARDLRALVVGGEAVEAVVGGQGHAVLVQDAGLRGVDIFNAWSFFVYIFLCRKFSL